MTVPALKRLLFLAAATPFVVLTVRLFTDDLGANPVEAITHETGVWTLRLLLATLAVTPLRWVTGWNPIITVRRMLGLFAFFYACLHFSIYLILDQFFDVAAIVEDVRLRPYITAGFTGFVLLIPLALTSTAGMIRRLGGRRWRQLHRLVYVSAGAGVVHYLWLVRVAERPPLIYGAILVVLLGMRVWVRARGPLDRLRQGVAPPAQDRQQS